MHVLLFAPHYAPEFEGGTEGVVRAQARELAALGHRVRIVAGSDRPWDGCELDRATIDGLEVSFLPRPPDELYGLDLTRPRMARVIEGLAEGADLFHVHHWSTLHRRLVRDLARRGPVVVTLHDLFVTCPLFFRRSPDRSIRCPEPGDYDPCARCVGPFGDLTHEAILTAFAEREAWVRDELAAAALVIAPSRAQIERLTPFVALDPDHIAVVPHGLSRPLERVVHTAWDPARPLRAFFLGHRTEIKGVHLAVQAVAALPAESRARIEIVFLGDSLEPNYDERLQRLAGDVRLRFEGGFSHAGLAPRVRDLGPLHVGLFPSLAWESYGLVPDELMALGLPIWVGDRGAPRERVGAAGRVLPVGKRDRCVPAWTRAFAEVLARPDMLEAERRALSSVATTAREAVSQLDALYRSLPGG